MDSFSAHNHSTCVSTALKAAETICDRNKAKLTPARRRVFEILLETHSAMGAYDILNRLAEEGGKPQPPVVYRALEFLSAQGLVHKIEHLNAFVACAHADTDHHPAFMICKSCNSVAEAQITLAPTALRDQAAASGFAIEQTVIEARGLCPKCQAAPCA